MQRRCAPERWLDDYGRMLFKYAYARVRDSDVAEEMVQDTLLAAWRGRRRFAGKSSERTWLVGILKHRLADHWRSVQRRARTTESLEVLGGREFSAGRQHDTRAYLAAASPAGQPDTDLEQRQFWRVVADCLDALPPGQARAFRLCELDGLETVEICRILEIAPTNLWVILHRARVRMREQLTQRGFSAALR